MDAHELAEWYALSLLEPIGPARDDFHAGVIASSIYNANPYRKSRRPVKPTDLINFDGKPRARQQTPDQMKAILLAWTHALGGKVVKRGDNRQP